MGLWLWIVDGCTEENKLSVGPWLGILDGCKKGNELGPRLGDCVGMDCVHSSMLKE